MVGVVVHLCKTLGAELENPIHISFQTLSLFSLSLFSLVCRMYINSRDSCTVVLDFSLEKVRTPQQDFTDIDRSEVLEYRSDVSFPTVKSAHTNHKYYRWKRRHRNK